MKVVEWMKAIFAGLLSIAVLCSSAAAEDKPREPTKEVHLDFSTPRERQIELALSAAPTEVSSKATVYILGHKGYEKIREGTNGFSCLIERAFKGTTETAAAPACFDAEGSRTLVHTYLRREELRAEGKSEAEIKDDIAERYKDGRFKAPGAEGRPRTAPLAIPISTKGGLVLRVYVRLIHLPALGEGYFF
jgi:hypothetical protein